MSCGVDCERGRGSPGEPFSAGSPGREGYRGASGVPMTRPGTVPGPVLSVFVRVRAPKPRPLPPHVHVLVFPHLLETTVRLLVEGGGSGKSSRRGTNSSRRASGSACIHRVRRGRGPSPGCHRVALRPGSPPGRGGQLRRNVSRETFIGGREDERLPSRMLFPGGREAASRGSPRSRRFRRQAARRVAGEGRPEPRRARPSPDRRHPSGAWTVAFPGIGRRDPRGHRVVSPQCFP